MVRIAHRSLGEGAVAQSVEQRTENPCVAGSIPAHTTESFNRIVEAFLFFTARPPKLRGRRAHTTSKQEKPTLDVGFSI